MNITCITGGEMSDTTGNKQQLLIVDDSKVIRVTARKILRDHFETVEAVDGENAWEILNSAPPFSVVVTDLTMPNLDGYGLLERIRNSQQPHIRDIPVIVITGANDSEAVKQRASAAGATDFIGKPFDSVHLLARTQAHASASAATRSLNEKMIEIEDQVQVDALTGLANEAAFMERGYQQLSYAIRHNTSLSIFRIGIDHYGTLFKQHGQQITEAAIKTVANVLQDCIRTEDLVARTGTAHFSLLLPDMNKHGIRNLANRISRELDGRVLKQDDKRVHISVSIGIVAPDIRRDMRFDELLKVANKRLFQAIKQGGNKIVFENSDTPNAFSPDIAQASEPVAAMPVATISEMIRQSIDGGAELEEIVLSEPDTATGPAPWSRPGVIVNRAQQAHDKPSNRFAGPAPATVLHATTEATANSTSPAISTTPAAPAGRAVFSIDDAHDDNDESIEITAPLATSDNTTHRHRASPTADAATVAETSPPPADSSRERTAAELIVPPSILPEAEEDAENLPERPGMFRRMLHAIGRLFGRRQHSR